MGIKYKLYKKEKKQPAGPPLHILAQSSTARSLALVSEHRRRQPDLPDSLTGRSFRARIYNGIRGPRASLLSVVQSPPAGPTWLVVINTRVGGARNHLRRCCQSTRSAQMGSLLRPWDINPPNHRTPNSSIRITPRNIESHGEVTVQ